MTEPNRLRLGVLDQSPIRAGGTAGDALAETIKLAKFVESLGYGRYWLAEHHASEGLAGPSPEIMIARVAAETSRLLGLVDQANRRAFVVTVQRKGRRFGSCTLSRRRG